MKNDPKNDPKIGEVWAMRDDSPWPTKHRIRILDVRQGWVRYAMSGGPQDNRRKLDFIFYGTYGRINDEGEFS